MTAQMPPAAPRQRPTTVTAADLLLLLVAAMQIIGLLVALTQAGTIGDVYQDAYRGTENEDAARVGAIVGTVGAAALGALFAVAFIVLATFNNRGKNPARITTWVIGGIGLCCTGLGLISSAVGGAFPVGGNDDNAPDPEEVRRLVEDALPSWYGPVTLTTTVVALLALLLALILLALPPSNEFFRKPEPVWQPPAGYPAPGTPLGGYPPGGAPGNPGDYPPPGGTPGNPPPGNPPPGGPPGAG